MKLDHHSYSVFLPTKLYITFQTNCTSSNLFKKKTYVIKLIKSFLKLYQIFTEWVTFFSNSHYPHKTLFFAKEYFQLKSHIIQYYTLRVADSNINLLTFDYKNKNKKKYTETKLARIMFCWWNQMFLYFSMCI